MNEKAKASSVLIMGVGAFAHSTGQILKDAGAQVSTYLTRTYAHYSPTLVGPVYRTDQLSSPTLVLKEKSLDLVVPM
ncbi:MAG TPA: phosphoribosylamine--glycine ligase, partial [Verrucomicrobiae bacterium]|nr:phosphoribosylamine--glycine ligase [Verrucomicrobiae bacterium]